MFLLGVEVEECMAIVELVVGVWMEWTQYRDCTSNWQVSFCNSRGPTIYGGCSGRRMVDICLLISNGCQWSTCTAGEVKGFAPAAPQSKVGAAGSGFISPSGSVESINSKSLSPAGGSPDVMVSVPFGSIEGS